MSDRLFEFAKNPPGDFRKRWIVTCSKCSVVATVASNKTMALPSLVITRKFVERGWIVGADSKHDLCPEHAHVRKPAVRDSEMPLVERIDKGIQTLEESLGEFMKLEDPKHHEKVVALLDGFHRRVFGESSGAHS